jgi:hypothetical protein
MAAVISAADREGKRREDLPGPGLPKVRFDIELCLSDRLGEGDIVRISGPLAPTASFTSPSSRLVGDAGQPGKPRSSSDDRSSEVTRPTIDGVWIRRGMGDKGGRGIAPRLLCLYSSYLDILLR